MAETETDAEVRRRLASVEAQLERLKHGSVQSELQMTKSGRLRVVLSREQRAQLWRFAKFVAAVALGAATARGWVALVPYLQSLAGHP